MGVQDTEQRQAWQRLLKGTVCCLSFSGRNRKTSLCEWEPSSLPASCGDWTHLCALSEGWTGYQASQRAPLVSWAGTGRTESILGTEGRGTG